MYRLYLYKFFVDFWVIVPVIVPLYKACGMSAAQILIVQAAFSASQLLFEIPAGYFADAFGRRRALVAAAVFMCCGVTVYAVSGSFGWFIAADSPSARTANAATTIIAKRRCARLEASTLSIGCTE